METQAVKKIIESPARAEEGFDHRTHIRDAKTGRPYKLQPYAYHAQGDLKLHERPVGSGNMFNPNGAPIGRWEQEGEGKNKVWKKVSEQHADVAPNIPVNREEHLGIELDAAQKEIAALKAEREAMLAEKVKSAVGENKNTKPVTQTEVRPQGQAPANAQNS